MSDDFDWERDSKPTDSFDWERDSKPAAPPDVHPLMSAAAGGMQGATFGFFDELKGLEDAALAAPVRAVRKVAGKVPAAGLAATAQLLTRRPSPAATQAALDDSDLSWDQAVKDYRQGRDESRAAFKEAHDAHPNWYTGGEIAGGIAMPLPGGGSVKGLTKLQALGKAIKGGAAMGGAYGLGNSEADLTKGDVGRAALDTGVGSTLGALGGAAGEGLGQGFRKLGEYLKNSKLGQSASNALKNFAEERAVKALGRDLNGVLENGRVNELGRDLLDSGVTTAGASTETMGDRLAALERQRGSKLDEILGQLDAAARPPTPRDPAVDRVNVFNLADDLDRNVVGARAGKPAERATANFLKSEVDAIRDAANQPGQGFLTLRDAEAKLKRPYQARVKYDRTQGPNPEGLKDLASAIRQRVEDTADQIAQERAPELVGKFQEAKRQFGLASEGADIAEKQLKRNLKNRFLSPSDYGVGAMEGAASGHGAPGGTLQGAVWAFAHKLARERGSSAAAVAADRAQKAWANAFLPVLEREPELLGKYGKVIAREYQDQGIESAMGLMHALSLEDPDFDQRQKAVASQANGAGPK